MVDVLPETPTWHHLPSNPYNTHSWIIGDPTIGERCWIGAFTVIDGSGELTIGDDCDISAGAQIYTHSTVRRAVFGAKSIDRAATTIGNCVHIGANATVLMGCTIGDHVVIGAGAVVLEGTVVPDYSLVVGVPATVRPLTTDNQASGER